MIRSAYIITLPLIILGLFLCGLENLGAFFGSCQDRAGIVLFLKDGLSEDEVTQLHNKIKSQDGVRSLEYLAKEDVLAGFARDPDLGTQLEALGRDPMPHLFEVKVSGGLSSIEPMAGVLASFPGVQEVDYGKEKLDQLIGMKAMSEFIALTVGILLSLVSLLIISQSFGLLFSTRRSRMESLRLSHLLLQGFSAGLLGGIFATILLFGIHSSVTFKVKQILFISWPFIFGLLISGAVLGCLGTLISWRACK